MFVLAHLSDVHLAPLPVPNPLELASKRGLGFLNWLRKRHRIHRREVLDAIVGDLKAQNSDHVAFTGDLVNLSLTSEFPRSRQWLEALGTPDRVTFVPGNHDTYVRAVLGKPEQYWGEYMRGDAGESFPFVRRRGPMAIVGLSTSLPTLPLAATGRLHSGQIDLAIMIEPPAPALAEFTFVPLFQDELRFLVSPLHSWAKLGRAPRETIEAAYQAFASVSA